MDIEFSGVTLPKGNRCSNEHCPNDACTAVWVGRRQVNVCGWHLKVEFAIERKDHRGDHQAS